MTFGEDTPIVLTVSVANGTTMDRHLSWDWLKTKGAPPPGSEWVTYPRQDDAVSRAVHAVDRMVARREIGETP